MEDDLIRVKKPALNILQVINDGRQVDVIELGIKTFLSPAEQYQGFFDYNTWLKDEHPENVIPDEHFITLQRDLTSKADSDVLIFYCHKGDVVLTARLAWEYICSYRKETRESKYVRFETGYMRPADKEPVRSVGFYIMKRPPEDEKAIGRRFKNKPVNQVREKLGKDWGMGCEGIQFVGITHMHYPELMDGDIFPFIDLPALAVNPGVGSGFFFAPRLYFSGGWLRLEYALAIHHDSRYGSGSLQQCSVD